MGENSNTEHDAPVGRPTWINVEHYTDSNDFGAPVGRPNWINTDHYTDSNDFHVQLIKSCARTIKPAYIIGIIVVALHRRLLLLNLSRWVSILSGLRRQLLSTRWNMYLKTVLSNSPQKKHLKDIPSTAYEPHNDVFKTIPSYSYDQNRKKCKWNIKKKRKHPFIFNFFHCLLEW